MSKKTCPYTKQELNTLVQMYRLVLCTLFLKFAL